MPDLPAADVTAAIDPAEVEQLWDRLQGLPAELLERFRTPGAFGPGIVVYGPEVPVPTEAPLLDRLLGALGRDPGWEARPRPAGRRGGVDEVGGGVVSNRVWSPPRRYEPAEAT